MNIDLNLDWGKDGGTTNMLGADSDASSFWGYWNSVKSYIPSLRVLPTKITQLMTKSTTLKARANKIGESALANTLAESGGILASLLNLAIDIKNKIETYLPDWMSSSKEPAGLGAFWVPVTIGATAIAALSYVSYYGLQLLKDYQTQELVIKGVEQKILTIEQAKALIISTKPGGTTTTGTILGTATSALFTPVGWLIAGVIGLQIFAPHLLNVKNWGK